MLPVAYAQQAGCTGQFNKLGAYRIRIQHST